MRYYGRGEQSSLVKFIVTNIGEIREKAYDLAAADARKRAERLARLNGVKLGSVLAVDEMTSLGGRSNPYFYYGPVDAGEKEEHEEVTAETLTGGHVRVKLRVRYAIEPGQQAAKTEKEPAAAVAAKGGKEEN